MPVHGSRGIEPPQPRPAGGPGGAGARPAGLRGDALGRWRKAEAAARRQPQVPSAGQALTDLALEAYEVALAAEGLRELPGVDSQWERGTYASLHRLRMADPAAAARIGKSPGTYVTVTSPTLWLQSQPAKEEVTELVAREVARLLTGLGVSRDGPVLVAGLGNWNATPDSLGPRVVGQLMVTRHLRDLLPPEKRGSLRAVAAVSPGVLGLTGIETGELVAAVTGRLRPAAVICVDALAAAGLERLCTTVQLADTGLEPGAGVGNRRLGLNRRTLGVPVLAMGVPTVIHARRLAEVDGWPWKGSFPRLLDRGATEEQAADPGAPAPEGGPPPVRLDELVVTPKEIDLLVDQAAEVLAGALNAALHEGVDLDEVLQYLR